MTSTAFDRIAEPVESALHDADPESYRRPEWVLPWHVNHDGRTE